MLFFMHFFICVISLYTLPNQNNSFHLPDNNHSPSSIYYPHHIFKHNIYEQKSIFLHTMIWLLSYRRLISCCRPKPHQNKTKNQRCNKFIYTFVFLQYICFCHSICFADNNLLCVKNTFSAQQLCIKNIWIHVEKILLRSDKFLMTQKNSRT